MISSSVSLWRESENDSGPAPGDWIAGIDFGTSSSSSSLWIEAKGRAKLVKGRGGKRVTSSTVTFGKDFFEIYIGLDPLLPWDFQHGGITTSLKNLLGLTSIPAKEDEKESLEEDKLLSRIHSNLGTYLYAYSKENNNERKVAIELTDANQNKRAFLPEQLIALILLSLRSDLLSYLNRDVKKDEKKEEYQEENLSKSTSYLLSMDTHLDSIQDIFSYSDSFIFSPVLVEDASQLKRKDIRNYPKLENKSSNVLQSELPYSLTNVVLGVPVIFSDAQRTSLKTAAFLAGFRSSRQTHSLSQSNISMFPESTAAAVSFGLLVSGEKKVLVVDIGGGTTDLTLIDINSKDSKIVLSEGNRFLGGQDFDLTLMKLIKKKLATKLKERAQESSQKGSWKLVWDDLILSEDDLERDEVQWRLLNKCRQCKESLSFQEECIISIQSSLFLKVGEVSSTDKKTVDTIDILMTKKEFEENSLSIIKAFRATVLKALHTLKSSVSSMDEVIHEVVLVGGTSRIPSIRASLLECLQSVGINRFYIPKTTAKKTTIDPESVGKVEFCTSINPEEIVCEGLAIRGAILMALAYKKNKIDTQQSPYDAPIIDVSRLRWLHSIDCVPNTIGVLATEMDQETNKIVKYFDPILEKGKTYPTVSSKRFKCGNHNQKFVTIELYEEVEDVISVEKDNSSYNLLVTRDILIERLEFYHKKYANENRKKFITDPKSDGSDLFCSGQLSVDIIVGIDEDGAIHYRAIEAVPSFSLEFSLFLIESNFNRCLLTPLELGYAEDLKELERINKEKDIKFVVYILLLFVLYIVFKLQFSKQLGNSYVESDINPEL